MAIWLVRAGKTGERENHAFENDVVTIGWGEMLDLRQYPDRNTLSTAVAATYPDASKNKVGNWASQLWAFVGRMAVGDLVALPLKGQSAIAFGRITDGGYVYRGDNPPDVRHVRQVEWIIQDFPRDRFEQDILYSLGAFMTVCEIKRNNAEQRIRAALDGKTSAQIAPTIDEGEAGASDESAVPDIEEYARTKIDDHIRQSFTGHAMAYLVDEVLRAQGYVTQVSPPGPDGGVDIVAGRGPMGFEHPRLCVQVKATGQQQDVKVLRELKGVMQDFKAEQGLLVSWSGFRRTVISEAKRQYFEIRLWDGRQLVDEVLKHYERFSDGFRADLPLKRLWILVEEDQ